MLTMRGPMAENPAAATGGRAGKRLAVLASALAVACAPMPASAQDNPGLAESLDEASARAQAAALLPVIADDVVDGERFVVRGLPAGGVYGLLYRFRLRPEAIRGRPHCRMQIVQLHYEFAQRSNDLRRPVRDYDLLAIKRSGGFRSGSVTTSSRFLILSPAPPSHEEQVARCAAADRDRGWLYAADDYAFSIEADYLTRLREALGARGPGVALRCRREGGAACPVSQALLLRTIAGERREFQVIRLGDRREIAQLQYYDEILEPGSQETRSVIIEGRPGTIESVTLVYGRMVRPAI